jgi:CMP-N,N'-diacetyllegionaminic acid synthase
MQLSELVFMTNMYLAIVTARSGSKRLPGKNVRPLCGKPLFVWSVLAGLACSKIARIIVSTDSAEYQRIAIAAGADCPWLRDSALAADSTSSADVVKEVLDRLGDEVQKYRGLILLQPTSPLRTVEDISGALALFESRNAPAVVSVSEAECPPIWMGQLPDSLLMDQFMPALR